MREGLVLIVDDDPLIREVLRRTLEGHGYEVALAESVKEAWANLSWDDFDLVLTDLQMPEESGMTLLREIKQRLPQLPVVMITAYGTMDVVIEALRNGANDFLTKPHKPRELLDIVAREIARYRFYKSPRDEAPAAVQLEQVEIDEIDSLLANVRARTAARCVLLVNAQGSVIAIKGSTSGLNVGAMGRLVVENAALASTMVGGGDVAFRLHFHEGDRYSICSGQVVPEISLLVVFGQGVRLGTVLHYIRAAAADLEPVLTGALARMARGPLPLPVVSSDGSASAADSLPPEMDEQLTELFSFKELLDSGDVDEALLATLEMQFADLWDSG